MQAQAADNDLDIRLMRNDPRGFVESYQETVRIIVRKYVSSGMFRIDEHDDVIQAVNEELLRKLDTIGKRYNGTALVRTYVSAIIRNICLKLRESFDREPKTEALSDAVPDEPYEMSEPALEHALIEKTRRVFRAILEQYNHRDQLPRLLFHLKLRYRIPVSLPDILAWYPACGIADRNSLLGRFGRGYEGMEEREIYALITPVLNRAKGKENTEDAARKWTKSKIEEILELLNGSPPTARFDEDSLKILLEDYFSPFLQA